MNAKTFKIGFVLIVFVVLLFIGCGSKSEMSLEDFLVIETEFLGSDLSQASKKAILDRYGYTIDQFDELSKRVEEDESLQEELGKIRLEKNIGF